MKARLTMIDIHSHVLPCVDDGAGSLETSRRLLSQYIAQGIDCVICTPHQNKMVRRTEVLRCEFAKFKEAVADVPVQLYLGAEILYYTGMVKDLAKGELLTLGDSKYVLVEFNDLVSAEGVCDAAYELTVAGYVPIVAHIERYVNLTNKDYLALKEQGALIQINAGLFSCKKIAKNVKYLLKNELVDFIATDCHDPVRRCINISAAKVYISKKFPKQYDKFFVNSKY